VIEGGRRGAVGIVEEERDFGCVAGGPRAGPGEDDVVMPDARMFLYELSPITQRSASTRFDLPQPLGPTMPVRPRSMTNSPGSTKDLKPRRRRRENFIGPASCGRAPSPAASPGARRYSML